MIYESSPKHSGPWQRGRKGSLCPPEINAEVAQQMLTDSAVEGSKRYAVREGRAYCAQEHRSGSWHGYPVGWVEVPMGLRLRWVREARARKRDIRRYWT